LGWIVKIKPSDIKEFDGMMTKEQYENFVGKVDD
jgi:glycine cleavage system H lipoate-binding protein